VPLVVTFPWLTVLTPYRGEYVPSLAFGAGPRWLELGPYRFAAAICFEDTVPQVARRFFSEVPDGRQPDVLVNLSNDGWFGGSSEHEMHLAASIFRAVEFRVPLARAANTGISAIVDGNGRVLQALHTLEEGVVSGVVPLDDRTSHYTVWGDWLGLSCLAVTIGLVPLGLFRPRAARPV
jgi:apolipoprotein N-acyltransferase